MDYQFVEINGMAQKKKKNFEEQKKTCIPHTKPHNNPDKPILYRTNLTIATSKSIFEIRRNNFYYLHLPTFSKSIYTTENKQFFLLYTMSRGLTREQTFFFSS